MAKIAVITDTHFGIKNSLGIFQDYFFSFFDTVFFPYIDKHDIKTVIHMGDCLDNRKFVNIDLLRSVRRRVFDELKKRKVDVHLILGNHDLFYRSLSSVNSPTELFSGYDNVKIYDMPTTVNLHGIPLDFIPWVNKTTEEHTLELLKTTLSAYAFGHLELEGFQVLRGIKSDKGLSKQLFSRFRKVFTGHFHQKHDDGQIFYLGTSYDMTFSDLDETKGFHVFDTETGDMEFVPNPNKMFFRLIYDDASNNYSVLPPLDIYENKYVRLLVKNKTNPYAFERFVDALNLHPPAHINIVDETDIYLADSTDIDQTKDTLQIINSEIETLTEITNKDKLKSIMHDLYIASHDIE
jgi:DNA repair exonuclease SbcCD nuclease subunit